MSASSLPPLVGRARELAELAAALEDATTGRGRVVLVSGDGGIGKTRLCEELEVLARDRGCTTIWGHALESGGPPTWQWIQIVRGLLRGPDGAELVRAVGAAVADDLAYLAPELRSGDPHRVSEPVAAHRIGEAVAALLCAAAIRRPLLVVLDDLHAADESTLRVLGLVAALVRDARVLVAGTYRETEARLSPTLGRLFADLGRRVPTVALRRLDRQAIDRIMSDAVGLPLPERLLTPLFERSAGNPLFARELARSLTSPDPTSSNTLGASRNLPAAISDVILGRLALLSAAAQEVVVAAAVGGLETELDVVALVTRRSRSACLEALDGIVGAGLAVARDGGERVSFPQSVVHDAIYRSVPIVRRAALHHALAVAAEPSYTLGPEPRYEELAHHFTLGATVGGRDQIVRYQRLAGERAAARLAIDEAVRHFGRALAYSVEGSAERAETLLALADAQAARGDAGPAAESFAGAAALARQLAAPELLARVALVALRRAPEAGSSPGVVLLADEALAALGERQPAARAELLARLAAEPDAGSAAGRAERGRLATELARTACDPEGLAVVLLGVQGAIWSPDNLRERLGQLAEVQVLAARLGRRDLALGASTARFQALAELGDLGGADGELAAARHLADELRSPYHAWLATVHGAMLALSRGQHGEAERLAAEAAVAGERAGAGPDARAQELLVLWRLRRTQGRLPELGPRLEAMTAESAAPVWRLALAQARLAAGDDGGARELVKGLPAVAAWRIDASWLGTLVVAVETAVVLGDGGLADQAAARLAPYAGRRALLGRAAVALDVVGTPASRPAAPSDRPLRLVLRDGDWIVTHGDLQVRVKDSKGLRYLAELIARPGKELHVSELVGRAEGGGSADDSLDDSGSLPGGLRLRLLELARELDEAERGGDRGRALAARAAMEELSESVGPRTQRRAGGADDEKLRQSVTKRLRDAIKRISEKDERLGRYLTGAVRTGVTCSYVPPVTLAGS